MIKRTIAMILCILLASLNVYAFEISYDGITEEYTGREVSLYVGGELVESDMPAIIMNDRTLVPARAVFERFGAGVLWDESERKVVISYKDITVELTVDSDVALVNGEESILDCPAKIINDRTMIPVRFPAEAIGCLVSWNGEDASVSIDMPGVVTDVSTVFENGYVTTTVSFEGEVAEPELFTLSGNRIVVDIGNAILQSPVSDTKFDGINVKSVRVAQFRLNPYIVRLVADVDNIQVHNVEKKGNSIVFISMSPEVNPDGQLQPDLSWANGLELSEKAKEKIVLVDPGHGGEDVGAIGGGTVYEKDINLSVSLYLRDFLSSAGAAVYMMRDTDKTVSLHDRPDIAHKIGADLFVSVHSNSFATETPHGTTVLYYGNPEAESAEGKMLAENIQEEIVSAIGTYDRGITDGSEMYVIRKTDMPSVIVEMAFISNPSDRAILTNDNCRRTIAQAIARGIIKTLNEIA